MSYSPLRSRLLSCYATPLPKNSFEGERALTRQITAVLATMQSLPARTVEQGCNRVLFLVVNEAFLMPIPKGQSQVSTPNRCL